MKKLTLAMAVALASVGAQAAPTNLSFSGSTGAQQITELVNQSFNLAKFDSALGTLLSVTLDLGGAFTTSINLTNNAAQTQQYDIFGRERFDFSSTIAGLDALLVPNLPAGMFVVDTASTGVKSLAVGASAVEGPLSGSGSKSYSAAQLASLLGSFSGAAGETFGLGCSTRTSLVTEFFGGNLDFQQSSTAACDGKVTYVYEPAASVPVPEPMSLALVGIALAAAGAATRRKA